MALPGGGAGGGRLLRAALVLCLLGRAATWTAFADQENVPNVPGTSLMSELVLPTLGGQVDFCAVAATSLSKGLLVCGTGQPCGTACGMSWNSLLRDAQAIIGQPCDEIERRANAWAGEGWGVDGVFSQADYLLLEGKCLSTINCDPSYCAPSLTSSALRPHSEECDAFSVSNGSYSFPFLTWRALQFYERNSLGCSGGLNTKRTATLATWACVHQPECRFLSEDDMACFRYDHVRGEFLFWGWNSRLSLAAPLAQLDASFCDDTGASGILDARITSGDRGVNLQNVVYVFYAVDPVTGQLFTFRSGGAAELGAAGCDPVRLQSKTRYWLEMDAGEQYYIYKGWFQTDRGPSPMKIATSVYPVFGSCDSLGVTLQWCKGEGPDLDVYLFVPDAEGGQYVLDEAHALYWGTSELLNGGGAASGGARLALELDDLGGGEDGDPFTFGPESVLLEGRLMPGKYAVMSMIWTGNPSSTYTEGCATVSLYSGSKKLGRVLSRSVGPAGAAGNWWHVFNIVVEFEEAPPAGQDWTQCASCGRRVSYEVVDRIVQGPAVDDDGNFPGNTGAWGGAPTEEPRLLYRAEGLGQCILYAYVGIKIFDAVSGDAVETATFRVDGGAQRYLYPQQGVLSTLGPEGFGEGFPLLEGPHTWLIESEGYSPYTLDFTIEPFQETAFFAVSLVPGDGRTRAVLRWGDRPSDLDLYVVPVGVTDDQGSTVDWVSRSVTGEVLAPPPTIEPGHGPYLWWGVNQDPESDCSCVAGLGSRCQPTCVLVSTGGGAGGEQAELSIDRDDLSHGEVNLERVAINAPEVATLDGLLPGTYFVYVNAYPFAEATPTFPPLGGGAANVEVDVWLGDGVEVTLVDTVSLPPGSGGKWFWAGWFEVTPGEGPCDGPAQKRQRVAPGGYCYAWYRAGTLVERPVARDYWPLELSLKDAVVPGATFESASVDVFSGGGGGCPCGTACDCSALQLAYATAALGPGAAADGGWWQAGRTLPLANGDYTVVVRSAGYYDRQASLRVLNGLASLNLILVPLAEPGGMRIVLSWAARPYDCDLWVANGQTPVGDFNFAVFWGQRNDPPSVDASLDGVQLDRDSLLGWGPETVSLRDALSPGVLRVGVNVYGDGGPASDAQCFTQPEQYDYSGCRFAGGELVEFFGEGGLLASSAYVADGGSWWVVGVVEKLADGSFTVAVQGDGVASQSAACEDIVNPCPL